MIAYDPNIAMKSTIRRFGAQSRFQVAPVPDSLNPSPEDNVALREEMRSHAGRNTASRGKSLTAHAR